MKKKILFLPAGIILLILICFIALNLNGKSIAIVDKNSSEITVVSEEEAIAIKTWTKIAKAIPAKKTKTFTGQFVYSSSDQPISFDIPVYGVYTLTAEDLEGVTLTNMQVSAGDIVLRLSVPVCASIPSDDYNIFDHYIEIKEISAFVVLRVNDDLGNLELPVSGDYTIAFDEKARRFIPIDWSAYDRLMSYTSLIKVPEGVQIRFPDHPVFVEYDDCLENGYIEKAAANYSLS